MSLLAHCTVWTEINIIQIKLQKNCFILNFQYLRHSLSQVTSLNMAQHILLDRCSSSSMLKMQLSQMHTRGCYLIWWYTCQLRQCRTQMWNDTHLLYRQFKLVHKHRIDSHSYGISYCKIYINVSYAVKQANIFCLLFTATVL